MRLLLAAAKAQFQMTRGNIEDLFPILTIPFFAAIFLAIVKQAGRPDLFPNALAAPALVALWAMSLFVAGELVDRDRWTQALEPAVAAPAAFPLVVLARVATVSSIGVFGFAESWLVAWSVFGVRIAVYHPAVFAATLLATTFAAVCTALVMSSVFALGRTARVFQNSLSYPFYLLGGILVPAVYLPWFLQPVSKLVFLSWAADLLRDSLRPSPISTVAPRLSMVILLGCAGLALGWYLLTRMVDHLRQEGSLGLI
jgi:ABC-2 type transport system permease protein